MGVTQKFVGDSTQLVREYDKIMAQQARLEQKLEKATEAQRRAGKLSQSQIGFYDRMTEAASIHYSKLTAIASVAQTITAETRKQHELAQQVKNMSQRQAVAQSGMIANLGPVSKESASNFVKDVQKLAAARGVDPSNMFDTVSGLLSATGGDRVQSIKIADMVAMLQAGRPGEMAEFASRVPSVMSSLGSDDAITAGSLMMAMQNQMRILSVSGFKNVGPALAAAQSYQEGPNREAQIGTSAALFAAIGSGLDDAEGAITKTALGNVTRVLSEVVPEAQETRARLAIVQGDATRAQEFLKRFGNNEATGIVRQLVLDTNSEVSKRYAEALPRMVGSKADMEQVVTNLNEASPQLRLDAQRRAIEAGREYRLSQGVAGIDAEARGVFENAMNEVPSLLGASRQIAWSAYDLPWVSSTGRGVRPGQSPSIAVGIESLEAREAYYLRFGDEQSRNMVTMLRDAVSDLKALQELREKEAQRIERDRQVQLSGPVNARAQTRTQEGLGGVDQ